MKKILCLGIILVLAMSFFGAMRVSGDNVYVLTGDVYVSAGTPGTAVDNNSYAMATYIYTAGVGPDAQPNLDQVEMDIMDADGVNPAYYQYDVGSGWDWEPCVAGVQDVMVVTETVWGMNGWTGANATASSNTTLSCGLFDVLPDVQIRMIPMPAFNAMGTDWINITWTGMLEDTMVGPNIANYDVQRAPAMDGPYASIGTSTAQVAGGSVYYNDTGLASGTYYYRIAVNYARGLAGYTTMGLSDGLMVSMDIVPPAASVISLGMITSTSVQLNWTAPGDDGAVGTASEYDVRYSAGNCAAFVWATATQATGEPAPQIAGSAESFTVPGLTPSTLYAFAQMTGDEVPNWSPMSNCVEATTQTPDVTAPAQVTDLATGTITTTSVQLTWTAPGDDGAVGTASEYDVRYSAGNCAAFVWATATQAVGEPAPQVAGSAESFTVPGLASGTLYAFAQMTGDEVPNWSPMSNCVEATTLTPDVTPPAASTIATGTITTTSVELTWTAPGDDGNVGTATTYDVRYSAGNCAAFVWATATQATGEPAPQVAGSAESFTVTGLTDSTLYAFAQMTADEIPNWSPQSNCLEATTATPDTTAPSMSGLTTSPATPDTDDDVTISITITDAGGTVTANITVSDPDGNVVITNTSMSAGAGANEFEFVVSSTNLDMAGTWTFTIWANDPSMNYASTSGTFDVTLAPVPVTVTVTDADGNVEGAAVSIEDSGGTEVATGTTSSSGVVSTNLGAGTYTVTVSKSGYTTATSTFTLTGTEASHNEPITLVKAEEEADLLWLWIIIIIIIILIVILLIWFMTRKKPAEEPKPEEEAEAEETPTEGEPEGEEGAAAAAAPAAAATTKTCVSCGREIKVEYDLCPFCGAHQTEAAPAAEEVAEEPKAEEEAAETAEAEKAAEEPKEEPKAEEEKKAVNCKNCGKEILPGFAICPYCGTSQ
jgi:sulfur transfer protein SufE/RNA polymerase subunit RPABC4/transcription elongation factor Spt4